MFTDSELGYPDLDDPSLFTVHGDDDSTLTSEELVGGGGGGGYWKSRRQLSVPGLRGNIGCSGETSTATADLAQQLYNGSSGRLEEEDDEDEDKLPAANCAGVDLRQRLNKRRISSTVSEPSDLRQRLNKRKASCTRSPANDLRFKLTERGETREQVDVTSGKYWAQLAKVRQNLTICGRRSLGSAIQRMTFTSGKF